MFCKSKLRLVFLMSFIATMPATAFATATDAGIVASKAYADTKVAKPVSTDQYKVLSVSQGGNEAYSYLGVPVTSSGAPNASASSGQSGYVTGTAQIWIE